MSSLPTIGVAHRLPITSWRGLLLGTVLTLMLHTESFGDLPQAVAADPRTVMSRMVVDGHVVTFEALTPEQARIVPPGILLASIDGQPARWYALGPRTAARVTIAGRVLTGAVLAYDPTQGNGNYPGVVSVGVVGAPNGNLILSSTGTASSPILDLNQAITLGGATAITLSSTSGAKISSAGTGSTNAGLTFVTSGNPGDAYVFSVNNNPSGKLLNIKSATASVATVDTSGNVVASGNITAVNGTFTGSLGFGGATLAVFALGTALIPASIQKPIKITNANNSVNNALFPDDGGMQLIKGGSGQTTGSYVPPVMNSDGTAVANSEHAVFGTMSIKTNGICAANSVCAITYQSGNTLSGAATFTSANSAWCTGAMQNSTGNGPPIVNVYLAGTSTVNATIFNDSGASIGNNTTFVINYGCIGT